MKRIVLFALLICAMVKTPDCEPAGSTDSPGTADFQLFTRVLQLPLFDDGSPLYVRFVGSQLFPNGIDVSAWFDTGFPRSTVTAGVDVARIPLSAGLARVRGGDFLLISSGPGDFLTTLQDSFSLRGGAFDYQTRNTQWSFSGGTAKYRQDLAGTLETTKPTLFSGRILHRLNRTYLGVSLTSVQNATFVHDRGSVEAAILGGQIYQQFSPWSILFAEFLSTADGATAGKVGFQKRFQRVQFLTTAYSFGDFPYAPPLFRPFERGVDFSTNFAVTEFVNLFGRVNYFQDSNQDRTDIRARAGLGWSLGSNRPNLQLEYLRNEITYDLFEDRAFTADRYSFSISKSTFDRILNVRFDHLADSISHERQTQGFFTYRRATQNQGYWSTSFIGQQRGSDFGFTTESSIERPLSLHYYYLLGLGFAYVHNQDTNSGEAAARFGISRKIFDSGWTMNVEYLLPFPIGLNRGNLFKSQILFYFGRRFSWKNLDSFDLFSSRNSTEYGTLEGSIQFHGEGVPGLTILVNGEPKTRSGADGRFKVEDVPVGSANVSVNTLNLQTGYSIIDGPSRSVLITEQSSSMIRFSVERFIYFQGSIVTCGSNGKVAALENAMIKLEGDGYSKIVQTSGQGGFQFDDIPPGVYRVALDPKGTKLPFVPRYGIVLTQDVSGYVIKLNCGN